MLRKVVYHVLTCIKQKFGKICLNWRDTEGRLEDFLGRVSLINLDVVAMVEFPEVRPPPEIGGRIGSYECCDISIQYILFFKVNTGLKLFIAKSKCHVSM